MRSITGSVTTRGCRKQVKIARCRRLGVVSVGDWTGPAPAIKQGVGNHAVTNRISIQGTALVASTAVCGTNIDESHDNGEAEVLCSTRQKVTRQGAKSRGNKNPNQNTPLELPSEAGASRERTSYKLTHQKAINGTQKKG